MGLEWHLVDDASLCVEILNGLLDEYGKKYYFRLLQENFSFPVDNFYRKISLPHNGAEFEEISKKFIFRYREKWKKCSLQKNTLDILRHFESLNIKQIILSAGNQYDVEKFIKYYGLDFFFEQILGTDNIKAEGKVELAMNFFSKSDYKAEEILIVGDTLHDLEIGNKIGCMTILSSMGHNSKSFLAGFHDHLIDDLRDISRYLHIDHVNHYLRNELE